VAVEVTSRDWKLCAENRTAWEKTHAPKGPIASYVRRRRLCRQGGTERGREGEGEGGRGRGREGRRKGGREGKGREEGMEGR